jgi:hypothetical protein
MQIFNTDENTVDCSNSFMGNWYSKRNTCTIPLPTTYHCPRSGTSPTFIRGIIQKSIKLLPLYLFAFALAVEFAQYFRIVDVLHLQNSKVLSIIIGTSFDIKDVLSYLIGTIILTVWERLEK